MLFQDLITRTQDRQKNAVHFWNIHNKRQYIRLPPPPSATGSSAPLFPSSSYLSSSKQYTLHSDECQPTLFKTRTGEQFLHTVVYETQISVRTVFREGK
jgi:hypothetical protein